MIRRLAVGLATLVLCTMAAQGAEPEDVDTISLSETLAMLVGRGGNVAVSHGPDGVFIVDDQYAEQYEPIMAAVSALTDEPVRFLINTHWHSDHAGSNAQMSAAGALVVAHENVRVRLSTDQLIAFFKAERPASPPAAWPVITFSSDLRFHLNGEQVDVFHVANAHTDGDSVVHFREANVVHTGDVFFNGFYPFIDGGTGGTVTGMINAVERILALCDAQTRIIPGHGPLTDREGLREYRDMLNGVHHAVANLIIAGQDADAIVAARPTAPWDDKWGGGFIKPETFTRLLFDVITRETLD